MTDSKVVLSLALPYTDNAGLDLAQFLSCWKNFRDHNGHVPLRAVLLLSLSGNPILDACKKELRLMGYRAYVFADEDWGRILNDSFLFSFLAEDVRYWLHTDTLHGCCRPFLQSVFSVLGTTGKDLWLLHLCERSLDADRSLKGDGYSRILALEEEEDCGEAPWTGGCTLDPFALNLRLFRKAVDVGMLPLRCFAEYKDWCEIEEDFEKTLQRVGGVKGCLEPHVFESIFQEQMEEDL